MEVTDDWVSATAIRNYLLRDPLVDWLRLYGREHGFIPDDELPDYDDRLEFAPFIMGKGSDFDAAITAHLRTLTGVKTIAERYEQIRDPASALATVAAMAEGQPVIHQGVLHDEETRTYGAPDFLVRSDVLNDLFPGTLTPELASTGAPALGSAWHYVIVDVKFTTLHLLVSGQVGNSGSSPAYKGQLFIYNRALASAQGFAPEDAYLLGRGWEMTRKGESLRGVSAMERLGPVVMDAAQGVYADAGIEWMRRVRAKGKEWVVLPEPSVPELYPNAANDSDFPWHNAKSVIAKEVEELTTLWNVGVDKRNAAHRVGIKRWRDPSVTAESLGVTGPKTAPVLQAMLDINRDTATDFLRPPHVGAAEDEWRAEPALEFFVDFETVSNLNDDFSKLPAQNGQPLIYMIGCGHVENGQWAFESFTTDALTEQDEAKVIDEWLLHMGDVAKSRGGDLRPSVIHWSFAEPVNFQFAYDSARERHPEKGWPADLGWFDLWEKVFKTEPVVVRGAMGFGLKAVAKAMHGNGLIATSWGDSKVDGLGAMVGAWRCDTEARESGKSMVETALMGEIVAYNEVDCRVMWEILGYLRAKH